MGQNLYGILFLYLRGYFFDISEWYILDALHILHEKLLPILRLSVFQQLMIFDSLAMIGSASGGAKTAHIHFESGRKDGWVAEEEIMNGAVRYKNEYWKAFSALRDAKGRVGRSLSKKML